MMKRLLVYVLLPLILAAAAPTTLVRAAPVDVSFQAAERSHALEELGSKADVPIIIAEEIGGTVDLHVEREDFETVLEAVLAGTDYQWVELEGHYLVAPEGSSLVGPQEETQVFSLQYAQPSHLVSKLDSFPAAFTYDDDHGIITVHAVPLVLKAVAEQIATLDAADSAQQAALSLEVVEITQEKAETLGLREAALELPTPEETMLSILSDQSVLSLLADAALSSLQVEASHDDELRGRAATPEIVTAVGRPATLRAAHDRIREHEDGWVIDDDRGLEVVFTPLRIDDGDGGAVHSEIQMSSPSKTQLDTEVTLKPDEPKLLAVIEQQSREHTSQALFQSSAQKERYLAVYATAKPMGAAPAQQPLVPTAAAASLEELLWPEGRGEPLLEDNYVEGGVSPGDPWQGRLRAGAWLTDRVRLDGEAYVGTDGRHWVGAAGRLPQQDTRFSGRVYHDADDGIAAAAGIEDHLHLEGGFTVAAGVYPLVYSFGSGTLQGPYWWASSRWQGKRLSLRAKIYQQGQGTRYALGLGAEVLESVEATVSYSNSFDDDAGGRFWMGFRARF